MPMTRRDALARLAGLVAISAASRAGWAAADSSDPLAGTIAAYIAGLEAGDWTAAEITAQALERCCTDGAAWRAIDALDPDTALADARAADARQRNGRRLGPLDGVPVFAKSIYDMKDLPTTASSAEWAELFPERITRDALEVARLRAGGAIVLGKTAADDFAYRGNGTSSHQGATGRVLHHALNGRGPRRLRGDALRRRGVGNEQQAESDERRHPHGYRSNSGCRGSFRYGNRTRRPALSTMTLLSTRRASGGWKPSLPSSDT